MLHVVVLTGSRDCHNPLLTGTTLQSKAMLPILGKPMLLYVLAALSNSSYQPIIHVSSNDPDILTLSSNMRLQTLPSEQQAVRSLLKSLERLPAQAEWVLFTSGDHPLLTPAMIDYFVGEVLRRDLTFGVAAVRRSQVRQHYPQSRRTYFEVKGDAYSGGNLFLVNKQKFSGSVAFMEMMDRNRKKPWKNLAVLPPIGALKILLRLADIHEVARYASRVFQCHTGIVEMPFAECCMDVDKTSDKEMAEMILQHRQNQNSPSDSCKAITWQEVSGYAC